VGSSFYGRVERKDIVLELKVKVKVDSIPKLAGGEKSFVGLICVKNYKQNTIVRSNIG